MLRVNREWLRVVVGGQDRQVVGAPLVAILPRDREAWQRRFERARAGERVDVAAQPGGDLAAWGATLAPAALDEGPGVLVTVREVSAAGTRDATASRPASPLTTSFPLGADERYRRLFLLLRQPAVIGTVVRGAGGVIDDWIVQDLNAELVTQVAMTRDQIVGRRMTEVFGPAASGYLAASEEVMVTGGVRRFETYFAASNRWYLSTVFRLDEDTIVSVAIDVTSLKRTESELQRVNERLRDADRRKDEFLGMLSHELRNPLAPIRNSIYVLRHGIPGTEQARRAQLVIERQTEHLTRLVDDLLDVTRIARGKIELRRSRIDLREVVLGAGEDFRQLVDERGVAFEVDAPAEPVWADVDPTRITQVVGNLLHNAAKFAGTGGKVTLSLRTSGGYAELRVVDTGAGIDPALLPTIFDPFVQGDRTLARTEGGLGLGLALVRGTVELHGGTVRVASPGRGKGAEFVVQLPMAADDRAGPAPADASSRAARHVLVVDDNDDAADSLAEMVRMLGGSVDVAYDGPTALEKARATPPDVVLCDIGLPGMSGYEVAAALRARGLGAVRLIAVSGHAQPEDVRRALEAGFHAHVAKPPDPGVIGRILSS